MAKADAVVLFPVKGEEFFVPIAVDVFGKFVSFRVTADKGSPCEPFALEIIKKLSEAIADEGAKEPTIELLFREHGGKEVPDVIRIRIAP